MPINLLIMLVSSTFATGFEIEHAEKNILEMGERLYQIHYKNGYIESILKCSDALYQASTKVNGRVIESSDLDHEEGRGVYDWFKAIYKERKRNNYKNIIK